MRSIVAGFLVSTVGLAGAQERALHIQVDGALTADHRAGIELGLAEASQTASLLGARISVSPARRPRPIGMILVGQLVDHPPVPVIHLDAGQAAAEPPCQFRIQGAADDVTWHSTLSRYGASEVNERFIRRFNRPMTSEAWNAWFAVKTLIETALRTAETAKLCEAVARGRFDGHKGLPLSFDRGTRILRQPLYVIGPDGRATEKR